jgi:hypothetical protein
MISHTVNPAGQANGFADMRFAKSGTGVAAVTMHFVILKHSGDHARVSRILNRAEKRMACPICQGKARFCAISQPISSLDCAPPLTCFRDDMCNERPQNPKQPPDLVQKDGTDGQEQPPLY